MTSAAFFIKLVMDIDMKKDDVIFKTPKGFDLYAYMDNVADELREGLSIFKGDDEKVVVVFGSARILSDEEFYREAEHLGKLLVEAGFSVKTGGGPGIMEAALKGAVNAGGNTYGINVVLPHEQSSNPYVLNGYTCDHIFTRKVLLTRNVCGYVIMPGGFGTLDELFEVLTMISTQIQYHVPVILINKDFWGGLIDWIKSQLLRNGLIRQEELDMIIITNNVNDAVNTIVNACNKETVLD